LVSPECVSSEYVTVLKCPLMEIRGLSASLFICLSPMVRKNGKALLKMESL
jgi:hypothetical protein